MKKRILLASSAAALVAAAGLAQAQTAIPAQRLESPVVLKDQGMAPVTPIVVNADDKVDVSDLRVVAGASGMVFDGVLLSKVSAIPPGMRVIVTTYTFQVHEWLRGGQGGRTVTVRETGGDLADGTGMFTTRSHKLTQDGRYIVFLRPDAPEILAPFQRVLQVMDSGAKVADEMGKVVIGLRGGTPLLRRRAELPSLEYAPRPEVERPQPLDMGPPHFSSFPLPEQPPKFVEPPDARPLPVGPILDLVRLPGAQAPAGPGPAGLNSATLGGVDWNWCGYLTGSANYACLYPDNNHWAWFNTAGSDWNTLVGAGGSSTWIVGLLGGGIRNENPVAGNSRNNSACPSDATMIAGGYGSWAFNGNPNGICFTWTSSAGCYRIVETDVFVHPSNAANELQFRKTIVHELGHALAEGHEGLYTAIMVSGTWRVPPNYSSTTYTRLDDCQGARSMTGWVNGNGWPGTWAWQNWRDISTVPQTHPNAGSAGDVGPNVTQLNTYFANTGDVVTMSRIHTENRGRLGYGGPVTMKVYLSTNNIISSGDYEVWSGGWGSYGAEGVSYNWSLAFPIPAAVPTGNYYIGWILTSGEGQLESANDTGIMVRDSSSSFSQRTISVSNTVPANDACGNAHFVGVGSYFGSNVAATIDGSEPCSFGGASKDVWYAFTAPCNGTLVLDSCGSNFDTVLSVHTGCPGIAGNSIACDDDGAVCGPLPYRQSSTSAAVTAGGTYYIRVAGYSSNVGNFQLNLGFNAAIPSNNACGSAIAVGNGVTNGSTICATTDGDTWCGSATFSPDVWYVYTAPGNGALHVDTCGTAYDSVISVHSACPGTIANTLWCDDDGCGYPASALDVPVSNGGLYYIRVSGFNGAYGNFTMNTSFTPVNNSCSNAVPIADGITPYTTAGATTDGPTEPNCNFFGDPQISQDIWYVYTASCTGTATVDMCDSNYDSEVAIYAGSTCPTTPGTAIACNDDACGAVGRSTFTTFAVVAGNDYLIRVGGYATATGSGTIALSCLPDPVASCYPNCDGSTVLPCLNVQDFGCYLNSFAAGETYANCDASTTPPVLNVQDFGCYLNSFAAGCSSC